MTHQETAAAGVDPMPGGRRRIDKVLADDFLDVVDRNPARRGT